MRESIQIMLLLSKSNPIQSKKDSCLLWFKRFKQFIWILHILWGVEWVCLGSMLRKKRRYWDLEYNCTTATLSHHARPLRPRLYIPLLATWSLHSTWSLRSPSSVLSPGGPTSRGTSPPVTHRRRIALLPTCRCNVGFHAVSCYHRG